MIYALSQCLVKANRSSNLLLDRVPAAAVFSLRKIKSNYFGSSIRVRRSSDNVETDIGFNSSGDLDTIALLAHCGASSGFVTTWYDQSGNARNATQAVATNQPRIVNAGVVEMDGLWPTLRLLGGQWLNTPINPNRTAYPNLTVSTVYRNTALSGDQCLWGADNGSWDRFQLMKFVLAPGYGFGLSNGSSATTTYPLLNNTNRNVYTAVMAVNVASGTNVFVNGVAGTAFTERLGGDQVTLTIGAISSGGNYPLVGNFSEFVVFPSALSDVTRQAIERNQGAYFGISLSNIITINGYAIGVDGYVLTKE